MDKKARVTDPGFFIAAPARQASGYSPGPKRPCTGS